MIRILIVDDDPFTVTVQIRELLELGKKAELVGVAHDGAEGLREARRLDPDLVLMDVRMPVMDGFKATRLLKEENPDVAVVVISAFGGEEYKRAAEENGADAFITKTSLDKDLPGVMFSLCGGTEIGNQAVSQRAPDAVRGAEES
jgi:DNA-binding NarL/FixJ family response regulator